MNVLVEEASLQAIADTIRSKLGVADTYLPSEMADAIDDIGGGVTPTGTVNITSNGTHDVTQYASAAVAVPNSYSASDEGKVVNNGALVSQTSDTVTENGPVDTTLINSLTVNVAGGASNYEVGTYTPTVDTQEATITTSALWSHFAIVPATSKTNMVVSGSRCLWAAWGDSTSHTVIDSNNSKGGYAITDRTQVWNSYINFTATTIKAKFLGNGAVCTFAANQPYTWVAW